jgi:hypothetical protein
VGHAVSEKNRGRGYRFGGTAMLGRGLILAVGWKGSPSSFSIFFLFSLFLFLFSFSFITFSNLVQIASNQFVKIPKIQGNISEQ